MEAEWIESLTRRAGERRFQSPELLLGIGDDAAVLAPNRHGTVVTTDLLSEGIDFLLTRDDPHLIGRKALAVNLSDLAAMGAEPIGVLVAVALPQTSPGGDALELARGIDEGMRPLLEQYDIPLIGGDTNTWDGGLVISVTALGRATARGVLRRDGAEPGDRLLTTGPLGGSILRHQFTFEPRLREAVYLNEHHTIHAAIDISDGLTLDLDRLCRASGVGAALQPERIPVAEDAVILSEQGSGKTPLEHALGDGEDFELLLAVPESDAERLLVVQPLWERFGTRLFDIGTCTTESGLRRIDADGKIHSLTPTGFLH